ncbi:hypothetical protein B0H63DRAFT_455042 [Podospora didyma]|uniref:Uncharacterized protein n=1 Tax=Podospora didyma TaxID=330526 RepID=A0AAE0N2X1_9PEZI|nr:hypothetical protein B0H63DRAFT_455042 [Podospora didyma]
MSRKQSFDMSKGLDNLDPGLANPGDDEFDFEQFFGGELPSGIPGFTDASPSPTDQLQHGSAQDSNSYNNDQKQLQPSYQPASQQRHQNAYATAGVSSNYSYPTPPHHSPAGQFPNPLQRPVQGQPQPQPPFNKITIGQYYYVPPPPPNRGDVTIQPSRAWKDKSVPNVDIKAIYPQIPKVEPWGEGEPNEKGFVEQGIFDYDDRGLEFRVGRRYTKLELMRFFKGEGAHPGRNLTLWIQNPAAQVNARYLNGGESSKCRYRHCEDAPNNTILKGFWRVAFDEYSGHTSSNNANPFLNAGYMHLYCFEKIFDLNYLYHAAPLYYGFRIKADMRKLIYEKNNPMALNRDGEAIHKAFLDWEDRTRQYFKHKENKNMMASAAGEPIYTGFEAQIRRLSDPEKRRQSFLFHLLTKAHVTSEASGRAKARESRRAAKDSEGAIANDIGKHLGDLGKFKLSQQQAKTNKRNEKKASKGKRRYDEDGDEDEEEEVEDEVVVGGHGYRPSKRRKSHLGVSHPAQQGPRTRKRSREQGQQILQSITDMKHVTRSKTHEIRAQLEQMPEYLQNEVMAGAEPAMSELVNINLAADELDLYGRVKGLSMRNRREIVDHLDHLEDRDGILTGRYKKKPFSF